MQTERNSNSKNDQGINLIDLLLYLASKWKWFLLSVLICTGIAWYKYATAPFIYFRSATVIIKDPSNKASSGGLDRFDNFINKVNVVNEILQFRSKKLMREVVQRVHADINYKLEDGLRSIELYTQSPVCVSFKDIMSEQSINFTIEIKDKQTIVLSGLKGLGEEKVYTSSLNDTISLDNGMNIVVTPTNNFNESWFGEKIHISKYPLDAVADFYKNSLGIQQEEEEASILTLSLKDNSARKAEDIINMLITVYNEEAIKDKNQVAINTADFINERLIIIENELGSVESDLENFKQSNEIVDISSAAGMYMQETQKYNSNALELETQLRLANYIKEYLTNPSNDRELIPSNTGIGDDNIESQISSYNNAKLKRDRLIDDYSVNNPIVEELNNSLLAMKQNIIRAVDNMIVSINMKRNDAQSHEKRAKERITSIPTKERQMLSIERQQKIKESLYLFLLNRREENALSQAMVDNNARVIDGADGSNYPISPDRNRILLLGLLMGMAIPSLACLGILFLDTRVHSRKDFEDIVSVPYLGEIPQDKEAGKLNEQESPFLLAKEQRDSTVSEAFRILRTNMAFMARKDLPQQVIIFTSLNEGAGKTFISKNLGMSLVLAKKKVILIDMDIRRGTLSRQLHLHKTGLTNYLADATLSAEDIIQHQDGFDIIAAGAIAPNPAELLMDERLDNLVTELRRRYDYIVVDSVPVGIIADATISNRIADLTIFVARAGRLDRRQLPEIEQLYKENKLHNMALVLNGADLHRRYGYYGYYGYSYKYGYGKKKK